MAEPTSKGRTHATGGVGDPVVDDPIVLDGPGPLRAVPAGEGKGLHVDRHFTRPGVHPYDEVEWELRDAVIKNWRDGTVSFEQRDVEFPTSWSMNATTIVAQKYFRGKLDSPDRERSVKQMIDRVADTITGWGRKDGYFADDESAGVFNLELKHLLVNQKMAFNSPVWFNVGVPGSTGQCSACQPYDALVSTPDGLVPIGELVESDAVGTKVYDAHGITRIVAVKDNGEKPVLRLHLKAGSYLDVTPDHLVWKASSETGGRFVEAGELRPGDCLQWRRQPSWGSGEVDPQVVAEAALAGRVQGDDVSLDDCRDLLPEGASLGDFVERWGLRDRGVDMRLPSQLLTAPLPVVAAYLRSMFQAEGYVQLRERAARVCVDMISEDVVRGIQTLLLRFGIFSRVGFKQDARPDRHGCWTLSIGPLGDRALFAAEIGFVDPAKTAKLEASLELDGIAHRVEQRRRRPRSHDVKHLTIDRIEDRRVQTVYDIQTESGEYLSGNLRVHNCFILAVEDEMSSILNWYVEEGTIFKGGSGSGINLSTIRSSKEYLSSGGVPSGPVSFMRGADASAGTIRSGGTTRRAAKMVILNVDHPDIEEFIWCKAREEQKIRVLREAGFDMDLDSPDYSSIQYQNANNSVRVTDEFMRAYEADEEYGLRAVVTGEPIEHKPARDVMRQIAQAAWECADPGMQYDTIINDWHTCPESGRINASNPCCFVGETLVDTADGLVRFEQLEKMARESQPLPRVRAFDLSLRQHVLRPVVNVWVAGETRELVEVRTEGGLVLVCTPEHRFLTADCRYVEASDLAPGEQLRGVDEHGADFSDNVVEVVLRTEDEPVRVFDLEVEGTHNFAVTSESISLGHSVTVHNSEYMHLDNSACNLASLNLKKFYDYGADRFDVESYKRAVELTITAQEIIVGNSTYPTEQIGRNAIDYRELGLGYANLGGLMMSLGIPYDSDEGRAWCGALTALMTGHAYRTSAEIAQVTGPFAGYKKNEKPMLRVIAKHRAAVDDIDPRKVDDDLLDAARQSWDEALELGEQHGYRNSQATVLAPTGCLVGGTLVPTERGLVRLTSLGDPAGSQWQELDVEVATDEGPRAATKFYVNGLESVVTVTTSRGYRIQGTPKHRIKVVQPDGSWAWKRFGDLDEGDLVPLSLDQLIGEPQTVTLPPLGEGYWTGEWHAVAPRKVTPELAEFVGYFMGDGSLHARGIRLFVAREDTDVVERLTILGKELFNLEAHVATKGGYTEVAFHSVRLVEWWEACGLAKHRPHDGHAGKGWAPHIPDAILHTNDRAVYTAFVRGLFEADGTVTLGYPHWSTTSLDFGHDVQSLLLALGYPTTRKLDRTGWGDSDLAVLTVDVEATARWAEEVGFVGARKHTALASDHAVVSPEGWLYDTVASAVRGEDELTYDLSVPENVTYVANGFVSHNTIGLMMDCDTTGIEPDLALVKTKKMVGGGSMSIVNHTVPQALLHLGYNEEQVEAIVAYIDEHKTILGAPAIREEHLAVFSCAMGDNAIHYMGHVRMMAAAQPFLSGAISKCLTGDSLITTEDGLVRIGSLHDGEPEDTFREHRMAVASLDGLQKTDAFYYGGVRFVREAVLRSGHRIVATHNHSLLVADDAGLRWKRMDQLEPGDYVATRYGADLWASLPPRFDDFEPSTKRRRKEVRIPEEMTEELAFLLGAYVAEGCTAQATKRISITNSSPEVIERIVSAWRSEFGIDPAIGRPHSGCPDVQVYPRVVAEFLAYLGCGTRASNKRIPDAILRSPKPMLLAFLQGLALDAYVARVGTSPKWAICVDSPELLDDLQAVLTNLGIVHSRITKYNKEYDKTFDEVYASGIAAQQMIAFVPFMEPDKRVRADLMLGQEPPQQSTADVVPGITPRELYELIPRGKSGRNGYGDRKQFAFLCDPRTKQVSWTTLARVADIPGIELPDWLETVVRDNLHFSPVERVDDAGEREVFDISVPTTHAFVGNGIVNHNTVNMPEEATVEEVEQLFYDGWKLGLKAIAIYRDNCKVAQPLSITKKAGAEKSGPIEVKEGMVRRKLPKQRPSQTISFRVADAEGYLTAGEYPTDGLGEIFVKLGKQGSTLSGVMDAFAISVSLGLQYGVPLDAYVQKFMNMRFEPAGLTDDDDVRFATSIVDYLARKLAIEYLPLDKRQDLGIYSTDERTAALDAGGYPAVETAAPAAAEEVAAYSPATAPAPVEGPTSSVPVDVDAPLCYSCGVKMKRAGSCHVCESCGATSGCS